MTAGAGRPFIRFMRGAYHEDHGYRAAPMGEMVPIIAAAYMPKRVIPRDGEARVTCWCERAIAYVRMADICVGRTWTCGRRACQPPEGSTSCAIVEPTRDSRGHVRERPPAPSRRHR